MSNTAIFSEKFWEKLKWQEKLKGISVELEVFKGFVIKDWKEMKLSSVCKCQLKWESWQRAPVQVYNLKDSIYWSVNNEAVGVC